MHIAVVLQTIMFSGSNSKDRDGYGVDERVLVLRLNLWVRFDCLRGMLTREVQREFAGRRNK